MLWPAIGELSHKNGVVWLCEVDDSVRINWKKEHAFAAMWLTDVVLY